MLKIRPKYDPARERHRNLKRRYKLSQGQYEIMLKAQGGVCAICGNTPQQGKHFDVDHCHISKKVRGLLCPGCNKGLGMFEDDVTRLYAAIRYLELSSAA